MRESRQTAINCVGNEKYPIRDRSNKVTSSFSRINYREYPSSSVYLHSFFSLSGWSTKEELGKKTTRAGYFLSTSISCLRDDDGFPLSTTFVPRRAKSSFFRVSCAFVSLSFSDSSRSNVRASERALKTKVVLRSRHLYRSLELFGKTIECLEQCTHTGRRETR